MFLVSVSFWFLNLRRKLMKIRNLIASAMVLILASYSTLASAAFIVEAHSSGKANANYSQGGNVLRESTPPSSAIGTIATHHRWSSTADADPMVFSYTPGVDLDNTVLVPGTDLGNGDLASGLPGGISGVYNVYATWPASTNVTGGPSTITVTNDGTPVVSSHDLNTGGSGTPGGNDAWLLVASGVPLSIGNTYSVSFERSSATWVSQRVHGVMWELQIPEPSSLLLSALGMLGVAGFRRR